MTKIYRIELAEAELGQLLDGLEERATAWGRTADYLRTETSPDGEFFLIEECSDPQEAAAIAANYRSILQKLHTQREAQR